MIHLPEGVTRGITRGSAVVASGSGVSLQAFGGDGSEDVAWPEGVNRPREGPKGQILAKAPTRDCHLVTVAVRADPVTASNGAIAFFRAMLGDSVGGRRLRLAGRGVGDRRDEEGGRDKRHRQNQLRPCRHRPGHRRLHTFVRPYRQSVTQYDAPADRALTDRQALRLASLRRPVTRDAIQGIMRRLWVEQRSHAPPHGSPRAPDASSTRLTAGR